MSKKDLMILIGATLFAVIVSLGLIYSSAAKAEHPVHLGTVTTGVVCKGREFFVPIMEQLKTTMKVVFSGQCQGIPDTTFGVVEEVAGPVIDADGDAVYTLRIGTNLYTLGWPGHNWVKPEKEPEPEPIGFQV